MENPELPQPIKSPGEMKWTRTRQVLDGAILVLLLLVVGTFFVASQPGSEGAAWAGVALGFWLIVLLIARAIAGDRHRVRDEATTGVRSKWGAVIRNGIMIAVAVLILVAVCGVSSKISG